MIYDNLYWFQAMIIPTALNTNTRDFYCHSHILLMPFSSWFNSHLWNFIMTPDTSEYLFVAFRDDADHFLLQYIHNSTVDLKTVW